MLIHDAIYMIHIHHSKNERGLESPTQTVPESNSASASFIRTTRADPRGGGGGGTGDLSPPILSNQIRKI